MNRIKYENYLGAAGYDAVARRKIKELEKKIGPQMVEKVLFEASGDDITINEEASTDRYALTVCNCNGHFDVGKTYTVRLNNKDYKSTAQPFSNQHGVIGNAGLNPAYGMEDTGEPFAAIFFTEDQLCIAIERSHLPVISIKISTMEEKVESGNVVGFYVDADGMWHCTETYADAKKLIFEHGAVVSFRETDLDGRKTYNSQIKITLNNEGNWDMEYMNIQASNPTREIMFRITGDFEGIPA